MTELLYDASRPVDPLGDLAAEEEKNARHNRAKVGSSRPSSLLYTYGPGAVMDLPQFTIMPVCLDDWERIWRRREVDPRPIHAPRLRDVVRTHMRSARVQLWPHPWQPKLNAFSREGEDLGVPSRVFPQWLRCTGCDMLAPLTHFDYTNTNPYRSDLAVFEHEKCYGRRGDASDGERKKGERKASRRTGVPARYLLACAKGHLDEFPYDLWVHRGRPCEKAEFPALKMIDRTAGKGASALIRCDSCGLDRGMNEAQGEDGAAKLPPCRGRHPHLDAFEESCGADTKLMLIGASNLWFPATHSIIVMPETRAEIAEDLTDKVRAAGIERERLARYADDPQTLRDVLGGRFDVSGVSDIDLCAAAKAALQPEPTRAQLEKKLQAWDPVDLLVPEWNYLREDPLGDHHEDKESGLTLTRRDRDPGLRREVTRVLAVDRLRKVNALVGFTRIDAFDRVGDVPARLVPLHRDRWPAWTVATEDRGEGIFLELDENRVAAWEAKIRNSDIWRAHQAAHKRNFEKRFSGTAADVKAEDRLKPPRYWLVHTFAHVLIRQLAMTCGYNAASLSERLYAWPQAANRPPAAGLLIVTTASDSDGTLGGLVELSRPEHLRRVVAAALDRATRCSSDPVCARRTPAEPEDFLHGAACHCCVMASETSCERANRFLDRRFLVDLPGCDLGFFKNIG